VKGRPRHRWEDNVNRVFQKYGERLWSGIPISVGVLERGDDVPGCTESGKRISRPSDYQGTGFQEWLSDVD
jgi:hypothetical protein